ncbi:hypothetical protein V1512DRAFT_240246 [Lipomyces arxii]|uniref:uncharacterized protein n=1 Tax=Lipomyces arxii TaxID=56418 RepID=UPI0034CF8CF9
MVKFTLISLITFISLTVAHNQHEINEKFFAHSHSFAKRSHSHNVHNLTKRATTCAFPTDDGLVSVTSGSSNGGWAMSPDQQCTSGMYCPYACPPGQLMAQWDPEATSYTYPQSQYGGLYCNDDGTVSKPFPDKGYCYDGTGSVSATSSAGNVAFCQTVLPGNEAMLIPTDVGSGSTTLAVPDPSYWAGTAAHYYVNPPGVSTEDGCVWGSTSNPWGNWSPYVAGANADSSGITYVKLGWNPVYLEPATPFKDTMPNWGVQISCPDGGCSGLPCGIDPSVHGVNECYNQASGGAGGASFCVVGVQAGKSATIEVFQPGGSGSTKMQFGGDKVSSSADALSTSALSSSTSASPSSILSTSSTEAIWSTEAVPTSTAVSSTKDVSTSTSVIYTTIVLPSSSSVASSSSASVAPIASTTTSSAVDSTPLTTMTTMKVSTTSPRAHVSTISSSISRGAQFMVVEPSSSSSSSSSSPSSPSPTPTDSTFGNSGSNRNSQNNSMTSGGSATLAPGLMMLVSAVVAAVVVL